MPSVIVHTRDYGGRVLVALLGATLWAAPARAQQDTVPRDSVPRDSVPRDSVTQRLAPVVVTVTREAARSPLELPFAITAVRPDSTRPGLRNTRIEETLLLVPGVTVANRNNPSQDARISIRGFGARAGFGVRGVRVIRDGVPLTLPDGQTPMDYLDLESVGTIEVIRGSASALYGNAAGGVIDLRSAPAPAAPFALHARGWNGDDGTRRWVGAFGGTQDRLTYQANVSHTLADGYRAHARQRATNGFGRVGLRAGKTDLALHVLAYDMPLGENPGALTRAQFDSAPRMADPLAVRRDARKDVSQVQVWLTGDRAIAGGEVSAALFGGGRWLYNPLPTFIGDVDRTSYGGTVRGSVPARVLGLRHRFSAGVDAQQQNDDRRQFANCNDDPPLAASTPDCPILGREEGVLQRDQRELVSSTGVFVRDEVELSRILTLSLGARADRVQFDVDDRMIDPGAGDPDDSGERSLSAFSPMAGLVARLAPLHALYGNVSTAFETPTATELGNNPDASGGFNQELDPQRSVTYEVGVKGILRSPVRYDVAVFDTRVRDELIPFEIAGSEGRQFYRNAGRTSRRGAEVGMAAAVGPVEIGASYSYAHFRFREFVVGETDFAGNAIPGVPRQQLQGSVTYRPGRFFATVEGVAQSGVYADDANTARAPGYEVMHLRVGATALFGLPWLSPVLGVQNVFDRTYVGAVAVNAAREKYYEPAPGRIVFGGLTVGVGR
jgi:iron complex outermembrane receptor protein